MGMVIQGVAVAGKLVLDQTYSLTKRSDMATYGIDAAYDAANGTCVFQQISEFYDQAQDGAQLWIQVCAKNTAFAAYVQSAAFTNFLTNTKNADPSRQAKIIGLCYAPPTLANTGATDFPQDVIDTLMDAQIVQKNHFEIGLTYGVIVDGYNMKQGIDAGTISTQANNSAYAISLCITGSQANGVSAVGAALGKFARISTGRGIGAVADGALAITQAFLTNGIAYYAGGTALTVGDDYLVVGGAVTYNGANYNPGDVITCVLGHTDFTLPAGSAGYLSFGATPIKTIGVTEGLSQDDIDTLGDKQYFFITPVEGIQGLYWNDGATCTGTDQFFCSMEYMRVACDLAYDARAFFTALRGLNLPQDVQTGALDPVFCRTKESTFTTKYITPLTSAAGSGDITDASITVSGPTYGQDGQLDFDLEFIRSTILGDVIGTIGQTLTL
jgi:hypothetical protein